MYILGISAYYHNSAAVLIKDGKVLCAAEEERFTRIKFDSSFPLHAISYCIDKEGISLKDIDFVVYYEKPLLKFERIVDNFYTAGIKGYSAFIKYMPLWAKQKLFLRRELTRQLKAISNKIPPILFSNHHLSHAASAYYCSGFNDAAILTADGVGEWATSTIAHGNKGNIKTLAEMHYPYSVGLLYSAFTQFLGFEINSGEYKLMGLAPYAQFETKTVNNYIKFIKNEIVTIFNDGSIKLNLNYFSFPSGKSTINIKKTEALFSIKHRKPSDEITIEHACIAMAIQKVTEEILLKMAKTAKRLTGSNNLCLAGGVALNCVANSAILQEGLFDSIFIQPAAGDAGGALGAALAAYYTMHPQVDGANSVFNPYLGPDYTDEDIEKVLNNYKLPYTRYTTAEMPGVVAKLLADGKIVGRFAGQMEWGPRALGNRSILANPNSIEVWNRLNQKIKQRENFRPFAPAVLAEDANAYFNNDMPSPYMLFTFQLKNEWRKELNIKGSITEQLMQHRSNFPAITHVDYSARVQTVTNEFNPQFYQLLVAYKEITGHSIVLNTSFNLNNEPIVCTPQDAVNSYLQAGLDALAIGNFVIQQ